MGTCTDRAVASVATRAGTRAGTRASWALACLHRAASTQLYAHRPHLSTRCKFVAAHQLSLLVGASDDGNCTKFLQQLLRQHHQREHVVVLPP